MSNHRIQNCEEVGTPVKRKRVMAAVAQEILTSEDDDNISDAINICDILENHTGQHKQIQHTSSALHALGETIRNTLLEINEIREQNRERRHRELLEILKKVIQHDDTGKCEATKTKSTNLNHIKQEVIVNKEFTAEDKVDIIENEQFCDIQQFENSDKNLVNISNESVIKEIPVNHSILPVKSAENSLKILPIHLLSPKTGTISETPSNIQHVGNINKIVTVKQNPKEELQKMRAQMLELQRKKMEDRERKKRELLQIQSI